MFLTKILKRNKVKKTLFLFLLLFGNQSSASEIRVNSLGIPGLLTDEEVDFGLNPAMLGELKTSRIYGGSSFFNADVDSAEYYYKEVNKKGYLGYIWPIGRSRVGLQYSPSINIQKSNTTQYIFNNTFQHKNHNFRNLLVYAGIPVSEKLNYGIKVRGNSFVSQISEKKYFYDENHEQRERYQEYQLDLGLLYKTSRRTGTGMVISGVSRNLVGSQTYSRGLKLILFPEWKLTKRNLIKGILDFKLYNYNGSIPGNTFGFAWNYYHSQTFLLNFSLLRLWNSSYGIIDNSFFQAGVEKEILQRIMARVSLSLSSNRYGTDIESFAFGFGYDPSRRITVDLIFRKFQNYTYSHNKEIGLAASYYFADKE